MASVIKDIMRVEEAKFDSKSNLDTNNWYLQGHGKPDLLTSTIINLLDSRNEAYPISAMKWKEAFGVQKPEMKRMKDIEYHYPIMERYFQNLKVVSTTGTGQYQQEFTINSETDWVKRFAMVRSPRGTVARIMDDPRRNPATNLFEYKLKLIGSNPSEQVPTADRQPGTVWGVVGRPVPVVDHTSSRHHMKTWAKIKNQVGIVRKDYQWGDISAQRTLNVTMKVDTGGGNVKETSMWIDLYTYQFEQEWYEEMENMDWYSKYNRGKDGEITLEDSLNQEKIPTYAGIFDQIINKTTHSRLTYKLLADRISDAYYGIRDANNMTITLMTGRGGIRDIDRALREYADQTLGVLRGANVSDKFITGTGRNLALTGFFDRFAHIDGYEILVKHNPIFDEGQVAIAQRDSGYVHPESGYPLESHRLVFLDTMPVSGMANIQHPTHFGYDDPYNESIILGVSGNINDIPPSLRHLVSEKGVKVASHERSRHSYHRFCSKGIQIMRANRCLDMRAIL